MRSLFDWQIATRLSRTDRPMYHKLARTRYLMTKLNKPRNPT